MMPWHHLGVASGVQSFLFSVEVVLALKRGCAFGLFLEVMEVGVVVAFCDEREREDFRDEFSSGRHWRCHHYFDNGCCMDRDWFPQV